MTDDDVIQPVFLFFLFIAKHTNIIPPCGIEAQPWKFTERNTAVWGQRLYSNRVTAVTYFSLRVLVSGNSRTWTYDIHELLKVLLETFFFPHRTGSHWGLLEENKSKKIKKIKSTSRFHQNRRSGNKSGIIKSRNLTLAGRNWQVGRRSRRGGGNTKMWTLPRLVYHVLLTRLTINQIALCGLQERRRKKNKNEFDCIFFSTRT